MDGSEGDAEWDDFDRLLTEYKLRRRAVPTSPLLSRRYLEQQELSGFYPCPPPSQAPVLLDPYAEYEPSDSVREWGGVLEAIVCFRVWPSKVCCGNFRIYFVTLPAWLRINA